MRRNTLSVDDLSAAPGRHLTSLPVLERTIAVSVLVRRARLLGTQGGAHETMPLERWRHFTKQIAGLIASHSPLDSGKPVTTNNTMAEVAIIGYPRASESARLRQSLLNLADAFNREILLVVGVAELLAARCLSEEEEEIAA